MQNTRVYKMYSLYNKNPFTADTFPSWRILHNIKVGDMSRPNNLIDYQ